MCFILCGLCVILLAGNIVQFVLRPDSNQDPVMVANETGISNEDNGASGVESEDLPEDTDSISNSDEETVKDTSDADLNFVFADDKLFSGGIMNGMYRCGTDFEAGEYIAYGFIDQGNIQIADSISGLENAEYQQGIFIDIQLNEGQYIDLGTTTVMLSKDQIDMDNLKQYGIFQVGVDIEPGEYKITSITNEYHTNLGNWSGSLGGYEICEDDPFNNNTLVSEGLYGEQKYIELKEGQYLRIVDAALYKMD